MSGANAYTGRATSPGPLFNPRPVSRKADPDTSKAAEAKIRATGRLSEGCRQTLAALRDYIAANGEWPTTAELARGDGSLIHVYGRRLSDLFALGQIARPGKRVCGVTGNKCFVWGPK